MSNKFFIKFILIVFFIKIMTLLLHLLNITYKYFNRYRIYYKYIYS